MNESKQLFPHLKQTARLHSSVFCGAGAFVFGDVEIQSDSSVWMNAVIRGDVNSICIGSRTNIQDLSVVHVSGNGPAVIGDNVTVGHSAIIHACKIGNNVLVGMGSLILDGAEIGDNVIIGAGSLITPRTVIPAGSKVMGRPAKVVGQLTKDEIEKISQSAERYVQLSRAYRGLL